MRYNCYLVSRRPSSRLRKGMKGIITLFNQTPFSRYNSLRVTHYSSFNKKYGKQEPTWKGLRRAWVTYVIANEKMKKYANIIHGFE